MGYEFRLNVAPESALGKVSSVGGVCSLSGSLRSAQMETIQLNKDPILPLGCSSGQARAQEWLRVD